MYDPLFDAEFTQPNLEERWWNDGNVSPIWNLNEQFGKDRFSASSMWPGSPVTYNGKRPKYVQNYKRNLTFFHRMDEAFEWLTLEKDAPNFVLVYIDEPDETSHHNGPFSEEVREILRQLDDAIKYFIEKLKKVNLLNETNIIILSDHGMSEVREDRVIDLTDLCDSDEFKVGGVSPNLNLFFKDETKVDNIYNQLLDASKQLPFTVYRSGEVPAHYHFNNHRRIGSIVLEADDGYEIVIKTNPFPYNFSTAQKEIAKKKAEIENANKNKANVKKNDIMDEFKDFLIRKKLFPQYKRYI